MTSFRFTLITALVASTASAFMTQSSQPGYVNSQLNAQLNSGNLPDRRAALGGMTAAAIGAATGNVLLVDRANAVTAKTKKPRTYFKGAISPKEGEGSELGKAQAIFVSARPKNPANIPPEVVRAAGGGVPAVFFAIIKNPTFPARFELTENDITPEGDFGLTSDPYWWAEEAEWEISARVDSDGAIRTLDPTDLVGRTITAQAGEGSPDADVKVAVKERGFFGSYFQQKETS